MVLATIGGTSQSSKSTQDCEMTLVNKKFTMHTSRLQQKNFQLAYLLDFEKHTDPQGDCSPGRNNGRNFSGIRALTAVKLATEAVINRKNSGVNGVEPEK